MTRSWKCALAATLLSAGVFAAPQNSGASADESAGPYTFRTQTDLVFLPARVQRKDGLTIHGLTADQFVVEDNGVPQKSVRVEAAPDYSSLSLVVLVQCSRSAPYEFVNLGGLGTMIEGIVGDSRYEVAVASYGARTYLLGGFSGNSEAARQALMKLRSCDDSDAATIDAVNDAAGMLARRPAGYRHAILLVGEMRDHGSRAKLGDVIAKLGRSDTVIYSVAFSPTRQQWSRSFSQEKDAGAPPAAASAPLVPLSPAATVPESFPELSAAMTPSGGQTLLELPPEILPFVNAMRRNAASELAALSGGDYFAFTNKRSFDESLQRISNQIRNYYLLSFRPAADAPQGLHSLRVGVKDRPEAVVQARKSYWLRTEPPRTP